jgi:hypothetical protein
MRTAVVHYSASLMQDVSVISGALGRVGYRDNIGVTVMSGLDGRHTHTVLMRAFARASSRPGSATLDGSRAGGVAMDGSPVVYALRDGEGGAKIRCRLGKRPSGVGRHPRGWGG